MRKGVGSQGRWESLSCWGRGPGKDRGGQRTDGHPRVPVRSSWLRAETSGFVTPDRPGPAPGGLLLVTWGCGGAPRTGDGWAERRSVALPRLLCPALCTCLEFCC